MNDNRSPHGQVCRVLRMAECTVMAGFTFMEVLVTIVTIGLVVTGLAAAVVAALKNPNLARENSQATYISRLTMDKIVSERRSNGMDGVVSQFLPQLPAVGGNLFVRALTVTEPPPGSNGCPAVATVGACKLAALTVTSPAGGVVRATALFISYE